MQKPLVMSKKQVRQRQVYAERKEKMAYALEDASIIL
jgi:hypothetical protein